MSNAAKLADILKRLGDAHYQAADELIGLANEQPVAGAVPPVASAPADDLPEFPPLELEEAPPAVSTQHRIPGTNLPAVEGEGSLAMCPKHKKPYVEGTYGPYCTSTTDDPAWANKKGYCRITPKNVANYLRMQAA